MSGVYVSVDVMCEWCMFRCECDVCVVQCMSVCSVMCDGVYVSVGSDVMFEWCVCQM